MNRVWIALALCLTSGAQAQTASETFGPALTPQNAKAAERQRMVQAVFAACRENARHVKKNRRTAVRACVEAELPAFATRRKCRQDGGSKGLKELELRDYVQACMNAVASDE